MNVAEYVVQFLAERGVKDVFLVSGGGIMYLTDAVGNAPDMRYWCNYHEQACAIAAEGYARVLGTPGVCIVTTGPGSTNALSAIAGAWVDSIPVIVISGQVRTDLIADYSKWRQLGPQEINIVDLARPVTKRVIEVKKPDEVRNALEAVWEAATTGRPGPVWLSIPLDVQGADAPRAREAVAAPESAGRGVFREADDDGRLDDVLTRLRTARRPLILAGSGIHLARAEAEFDAFVRRLRIPVVATIGGMDLLGEDHPFFMGRFGPTGQRRANFALQNADLLLCVGSSMSVAAVGFDTSGFAPNAAKIMVNIDANELTKPHLHVDVPVAMDVRDFIAVLQTRLPGHEAFERAEWAAACWSWKARYPLVTDDYLSDAQHVNSYYLASLLSGVLGRDDVVLTGNSLDATSIFHSFAVTNGQRVFTNENFGAMGWDLPALVGACVARPDARVILVTGDGSVQFNSQELMTIGANRLRATIFVLNNGGYQSIRNTQERYFEARYVGSDWSSGIANPSFEHLASAYGLHYELIKTNRDADARLAGVVQLGGPTLCEVMLSPLQERIPRVMSRRLDDGTLVSGALQDQYPFMPAGVIEKEMSVSKPLTRSNERA